MAEPTPDLTGRTIVLTGASRGIGRAAAVALAEMGASLILVSRRQADVDAVAADVRARTGRRAPVLPLSADLSSLASVRVLAERVRAEVPAVDVLINNAGTLMPRRSVTVDGHETTFAVNHLAYFLLTQELMPALQAAPAARIVNVASEAHQGASVAWDDPMLERGYGANKAYAQSKLANVMFTYALARRLQGTAMTANALHPGVIATKLLADYVGVPFVSHAITRLVGGTPEEGADTIVWLASSPAVALVSGQYFIKKRPTRSSRVSYHVESQERLWELSQRLVEQGATVT
ncbi:MAG: SDR family oxidoreductase [Gemmatimonadales bacterium]|nr:SDR family oxidoreductase [Gemmatimonadales bacterium]